MSHYRSIFGRAALAGVSQGAWTALKFAVTAPGGIIADRLSFALKAVVLMLFGQRGTKRLVQELFGDVPVPEDVAAMVVQITGVIKPRLGVLPIFSDAELQVLTMPILLVGGTKDIMRDVDKIAARLNRLVPDLTVKRVSGAGHAMLETAPHLADFLGLESR